MKQANKTLALQFFKVMEPARKIFSFENRKRKQMLAWFISCNGFNNAYRSSHPALFC